MRFFGFPGDFPTNPFPQKGKNTHGETSVVAEVSGDAQIHGLGIARDVGSSARQKTQFRAYLT